MRSPGGVVGFVEAVSQRFMTARFRIIGFEDPRHHGLALQLRLAVEHRAAHAPQGDPILVNLENRQPGTGIQALVRIIHAAPGRVGHSPGETTRSRRFVTRRAQRRPTTGHAGLNLTPGPTACHLCAGVHWRRAAFRDGTAGTSSSGLRSGIRSECCVKNDERSRGPRRETRADARGLGPRRGCTSGRGGVAPAGRLGAACGIPRGSVAPGLRV